MPDTCSVCKGATKVVTQFPRPSAFGTLKQTFEMPCPKCQPHPGVPHS